MEVYPMITLEDVCVVHVASHYPPSLGGLERVVAQLATDRRRRGLPVEVFTSKTRQLPTATSMDDEFVHRFRTWEVANTPIIPGLLGALFRLPRCSIIHLHVGQAFAPEIVYLTHLLRRLPYVAHVHLDVGPSSRAGFLLRVYKPFILGPILRRAGVVVVFSDEQRSVIASRHRVDPDRIAVVPNGVDESFRYTGVRSLSKKPRLLFVGRLTVQKNVSLLLRALEGVSDRFETVLVGDGALEAELRQVVDDLRLHNVHFHGRADGAELRDLYRQADVFVLPSEREGLPLVLLEAMAMGLPIVATDVPGNRDVVVPKENGVLVPLGDPGALREALLRVTADPVNYRRMSENCKCLARNYSWREVAADFDRLYSRLHK